MSLYQLYEDTKKVIEEKITRLYNEFIKENKDILETLTKLGEIPIGKHLEILGEKEHIEKIEVREYPDYYWMKLYGNDHLELRLFDPRHINLVDSDLTPTNRAKSTIKFMIIFLSNRETIVESATRLIQDRLVAINKLERLLKARQGVKEKKSRVEALLEEIGDITS